MGNEKTTKVTKVFSATELINCRNLKKEIQIMIKADNPFNEKENPADDKVEQYKKIIEKWIALNEYEKILLQLIL